MSKLQALRAKRAEKITAMRQLHDAAAEENRDLTAEETEKFDAFKTEAKNLENQIKQLTELEEMEASLDEAEPSRVAAVRGHPGRAAPEAKKDFEDIGEFVAAVVNNPNDQRLANLHSSSINAADQSVGEGARGGFMVPSQFREELMRVDPTASVVRPRATVIPAGTPPDAEVTMPALDQGDPGMYAGVAVNWIEEGGKKPQTDAKLREISLKPHEVAGRIIVTDKLLRNWQAAGTFINNQLRMAIIASEDSAFLSGNGVGKPLGVINSGAAIQVTRATANDISYDDLLAVQESMIASAMAPVWVTEKRCITKLRKMQDPSGRYIWQDGARPGEPSILLGWPVIISDRTPALGQTGDIAAYDFGHYLVKDGSGIFISASEHVYFEENKTVVKAFWNVDGQPWMKESVKMENGHRQSPFVLLKKK